MICRYVKLPLKRNLSASEYMILEVFSSVDTMEVYVLIRNYIPNVIAYIFSLSETQIKSFISVLQDGVIESAKSVITKH